MRFTVMGQIGKNLLVARAAPGDDDDGQGLDGPAVVKNLERTKWYVWYGNVYKALETLESLEDELYCAGKDGNEAAAKLSAAVSEFSAYLEANSAWIPNYGDRFRHGETISTSFAESAVNQVVSKRMVKKLQMTWTKRGAHLLLQLRTHTLNGDLRKMFCRWYPGMEPTPPSGEQRARVAA